MIDFVTARPLQDAVDQLGKKTPLGSMMTSAQWERMPNELRDRAFFSSRVESERILAEAQRRLLERVTLVRRDLENGKTVTMDRGRFIAEMQDVLASVGYRPEEGKRGTLQDLSSFRRLGVIWDMNLAQAQGYAKWKAGQDPDILNAAPAQELIRVAARIERRLWARIWREHGGQFFGEGSAEFPEGRMIALKTDPIWSAISRFGTPWPPFDWGSGMGLRNIRRRDAVQLGLLKPEDELEPLDQPFNGSLSASIADIPKAGRERLRSDLGDNVRFDGNTLFYHPYVDASPENVQKQLTHRARAIADRGRDQINRARSEDDAAAYPPGFDSGEFTNEILASTSAVAVGRKGLYHEQWGDYSQAVGLLIREWLPDNVTVAIRDGHLYAFRQDLTSLSLDEIHALSAVLDARNGELLGYGQNLGDEPFTTVRLSIGGRIVGGFRAPQATAQVYAAARARDFADATGAQVEISLDGKEWAP